MFIRTTHDEDGEVKPELEEHKKAWDECGFIVHMLRSDTAMTFSDLCDEVWEYNNDYAEGLMDKPSIAYQLVIALEHGFAGIVASHPV